MENALLKQQVEFLMLEICEYRKREENLKLMNESLTNAVKSLQPQSVHLECLDKSYEEALNDYSKSNSQSKTRIRILKEENKLLRAKVKDLEDQLQIQIRMQRENQVEEDRKHINIKNGFIQIEELTSNQVKETCGLTQANRDENKFTHTKETRNFAEEDLFKLSNYESSKETQNQMKILQERLQEKDHMITEMQENFAAKEKKLIEEIKFLIGKLLKSKSKQSSGSGLARRLHREQMLSARSCIY